MNNLTPYKPFALVIFIFLAQTAWATEAWQDVKYIEKAFIEIALKNEYKKTDMRVVKWIKPIRYQFIYQYLSPNTLVETLVNAHLEQLADITQHSILKADANNKANLKIIITKDVKFAETITKFGNPNMARLAPESNCIGSFRQNQRDEITSGFVIIPVDHAMSRGLLPACIVEETTQVLGLPNDSDWVNPSVANDASKIDLLTGLDYIMLKLLYSHNLKPGMTLEKTKFILRKNLQKMEASGEIKQAYRRVKKGGIYKLLR